MPSAMDPRHLLALAASSLGFFMILMGWAAPWYLGAAHAHAEQVPPGPVRIPILIYHSVRPDGSYETGEQIEYSLTPEQFDEQLTYLEQHGYTPITMDEALNDIKAGTTSVARPVAITFDDGWENQYRYAFPILQKHNMLATFYIYTNPISKSDNFLTWNQVREMQAAGMTIGAHSLSHPDFRTLSPDQMRKEVAESRIVLQQMLGRPVLHFATPFGYDSPELDRLVAEAGYETGRSTYEGAMHDTAQLVHLTGFLVHRDMDEFAWILSQAP